MGPRKKLAAELLDIVADEDPFPITPADLDPSKQFTFNYVASSIQNHLSTRSIDASDDEIRELAENIRDDFWLMCCGGEGGGPGGGNPHHADFQDHMLDKLLNVRPKWPSKEPDKLDANLPDYYLAKWPDDDE